MVGKLVQRESVDPREYRLLPQQWPTLDDIAEISDRCWATGPCQDLAAIIADAGPRAHRGTAKPTSEPPRWRIYDTPLMEITIPWFPPPGMTVRPRVAQQRKPFTPSLEARPTPLPPPRIVEDIDIEAFRALDRDEPPSLPAGAFVVYMDDHVTVGHDGVIAFYDRRTADEWAAILQASQPHVAFHVEEVR